MSRLEELIWLEGILSDLKSYKGHNEDVIDDILSIIKYREQCEIKHIESSK